MAKRVIGRVWVDTGCLAIGDPCNFAAGRSLDFKHNTVDGGKSEGAIALVSTGWGDGSYPLEIETNYDDDFKREVVTCLVIDFTSPG